MANFQDDKHRTFLLITNLLSRTPYDHATKIVVETASGTRSRFTRSKLRIANAIATLAVMKNEVVAVTVLQEENELQVIICATFFKTEKNLLTAIPSQTQDNVGLQDMVQREDISDTNITDDIQDPQDGQDPDELVLANKDLPITIGLPNGALNLMCSENPRSERLNPSFTEEVVKIDADANPMPQDIPDRNLIALQVKDDNGRNIMISNQTRSLDSHLQMLLRMLSMSDRRRKGDLERYRNRLMSYVLASCFRKMNERFNRGASNILLDSLQDLDFLARQTGANLDPPASRNPYNLQLANIFNKRPNKDQDRLDYPHLTAQVEEFLNICNNSDKNKGVPVLYTAKTSKEFYNLFLEYLLGFRDGLTALCRLPEQNTTAGALDDFKAWMLATHTAGRALQAFARGRGLYEHLLINGTFLQPNPLSASQEDRVDDPEEAPGSRDEELDAAVIANVVSTKVSHFYIRWLKIMLSHFEAVDILVSYIAKSPSLSFNVQLLIPPSISGPDIKWKELLSDLHLFDDPSKDKVCDDGKASNVDDGDKASNVDGDDTSSNEETLSNEEGALSNEGGTSSDEDGMSSNEEGAASNEEGTLSNEEGTSSNEEGAASNSSAFDDDGKVIFNIDEALEATDPNSKPPPDSRIQALICKLEKTSDLIYPMHTNKSGSIGSLVNAAYEAWQIGELDIVVDILCSLCDQIKALNIPASDNQLAFWEENAQSIISSINSHVAANLAGASSSLIAANVATKITQMEDTARFFSFLRKGQFTGVQHCEASLANYVRRIGLQDPGPGFIIGVSKLCCPVCEKYLALTRPGDPFVVKGTHSVVYPCMLPIGTPEHILDAMIKHFGTLLVNKLEKIAKGQVWGHRRHESSTSTAASDSSSLEHLQFDPAAIGDT